MSHCMWREEGGVKHKAVSGCGSAGERCQSSLATCSSMDSWTAGSIQLHHLLRIFCLWVITEWSDLLIQCQDVSGSCCPDVAVGKHLAPGGHSCGAVWVTATCGEHTTLVLPSALSQRPVIKKSCCMVWVMGSHMFSKYRVSRYSHHWLDLLFPAQSGSLTGSFGKALWKMIHFQILYVSKSMLGKY